MGEKITDLDEIRRKVNPRKEEEENRLGGGAPPSPPELTNAEIERFLNANELGDGELYHRRNRDEVLHNKSEARWYVWQGHHYQLDIMDRSKALVENVCCAYGQLLNSVCTAINAAAEAGEKPTHAQIKLRAKLTERIKRLRSTTGVAHCLEFAASKEDPMAISGEEMDCKPFKLPCPNAVVNLKTGRGAPGRRDDYLVRACRSEWLGLDAPRPKWEAALEQIFLGKQDVIRFFKRVLGLALIGEVIEHAIIILWGAGANGKSLIMETISHVLGDLAGTIPTEMLLNQGRVRNSAGPSPDMASLRGRRVIIGHETDEGTRWADGRVKQLTGGDRITYRSPHDKYMQSFVPSHTLFLLTNNRPGAPGNDLALWRRVHLIEFGAQFVAHPKEKNEFPINKDLAKELREEGPGILAWMVEGCLEWQREGLNPPAAVIEATSKYQDEEDLLGQFIDDCCELGEKFEGGATALFNRFCSWFEENVGKKHPSQKTFGAWMVRRFTRSDKKPRVYYGLRLSD